MSRSGLGIIEWLVWARCKTLKHYMAGFVSRSAGCTWCYDRTNLHCHHYLTRTTTTTRADWASIGYQDIHHSSDGSHLQYSNEEVGFTFWKQWLIERVGASSLNMLCHLGFLQTVVYEKCSDHILDCLPEKCLVGMRHYKYLSTYEWLFKL